MNTPQPTIAISNPVTDNFNITSFDIYGQEINCQVVNAMRRSFTGIPTVGLDSENSVITLNTSDVNNEIIKQQLRSIPVFITRDMFSFDDYKKINSDNNISNNDDTNNTNNSLDETTEQSSPNITGGQNKSNVSIYDFSVELDVINNTNTCYVITTKDLKIKNNKTNTYLSEQQVRKIFPPSNYSFDPQDSFIQILTLRPKPSDNFNGVGVKLTCPFGIFTADTDGCFILACNVSYSQNINQTQVAEARALKKKELEDQQADDIDFILRNWDLLAAKRITLNNSFNFRIKSIGIYSSIDLVKMSCEVVIQKLQDFKQLLKEYNPDVDSSMSIEQQTMNPKQFNISFIGDLTIGHLIQSNLVDIDYHKFHKLNYAAVVKEHPSSKHIRLTISFENGDTATVQNVVLCLDECADRCVAIFEKIKSLLNNKK